MADRSNTADHETSSLPDELGIGSAELGELEEVGHLDGVDSVGSSGEDEEGFGRSSGGTGSEDQGVGDLSRGDAQVCRGLGSGARRTAEDGHLRGDDLVGGEGISDGWAEGGRGPPPDSAAAASWTNASGWEAGRTGLSPPDHRS